MARFLHSEKGAQRAIITVVIVSLVIAGIAVAGILSTYLAGDPSPQVSSSSEPSISTSAMSSSLSPNGLRLTLSLSQTEPQQGSGVSMDLTLFNTLTTKDNLTIPASGGVEYRLGPCSQLPLGVAIFRGDYVGANLSQASGLDLSSPGVYMCPAEFAIAYWSFAPSSDNITLVSPQPAGTGSATVPESMWTQSTEVNLQYWGYWSGQAAEGYPSGNASFSGFQPGSYTVAAGDAWGQLILLHFFVVAATSPLTCETIASDSSFVGHVIDDSGAGTGPLSLNAYYKEIGSNDTYVLALSAKAASQVTLTSLDYEGSAQLLFNPDPNQIQSLQSFAPNGTLSYPATFSPGQCSLMRIVLPQAPTEISLSLAFSDNEKQTFNLSP